MPITFESIQDPYGLRSASGALAQALAQRGMEERQQKNLIGQEQRAQQRTIAAEQRAQALKKQYGEILGPALAIAQDPSQPPQLRMGALQNYVSQTGDTSVLPLIKQIGQEAQTSQILQSLGLQSPLQQQFSQTQQNISAQQNTQIPPQEIRQEPSTGRLSDQQLIALTASGIPALKNVAESEMKRREIQQKSFESERAFHTKGAEKAEDNATAIRRAVRGKEGALRLAREAIETGETGPTSWANVSQRLGFPELMNTAGTQLTQAGKEFFFGNMQKVAAKAQNQWLEQRITKLAADVGDPTINALTKQTMLEAELELDKAYLDAYDRLAKQDLEANKFVKKDIEERAFKESEPQSRQIMDKASFKTRQLYEQEKGAKWLMDNAKKKVPSGTMLTPFMLKIMSAEFGGDAAKTIENAKKLGYRIPTQEEAKQWL